MLIQATAAAHRAHARPSSFARGTTFGLWNGAYGFSTKAAAHDVRTQSAALAATHCRARSGVDRVIAYSFSFYLVSLRPHGRCGRTCSASTSSSFCGTCPRCHVRGRVCRHERPDWRGVLTRAPLCGALEPVVRDMLTATYTAVAVDTTFALRNPHHMPNEAFWHPTPEAHEAAAQLARTLADLQAHLPTLSSAQHDEYIRTRSVVWRRPAGRTRAL